MKKKKVKVERAKISCKEYSGYIDEMPEEAKAELIARNPKAAMLFK